MSDDDLVADEFTSKLEQVNFDGKTDRTVRNIIEDLMAGCPQGTELEAYRLKAIIDKWNREFFGYGSSSREVREASIKCGISSYIDAHFWALMHDKKTVDFNSLELLRFGLFGSKETESNKSTLAAVQYLAFKDSISFEKRGALPTVTDAAKLLDVSRKTIGNYRKTKEYKQYLGSDGIEDTN
ncbi:MAG: helix-turn-helix domain-containing protein [Alphaproteobacteria bacterium]|nr:helix-turn-helix domain-containing protein [Alphaproteobacteria bacterium]